VKGKLLAAVAMVCLSPLFSAAPQESDRAITQEEIGFPRTAILDEIYDYGFQDRYVDISALTPTGYTVPLYIRPNFIRGSGQVIYKLPIGEVARIFELKGRLAVLIREPRDKFPPTSSSTLTLYLDDEFVCTAKRDWVHETLSIKPQPSMSEVEAAVARQRQRKGTSQHDETTKSHK
jgi:hypothetical protein